MKKSAILILFFFTCFLLTVPCRLFAADKIEVLKKQVVNDDPHRVYTSFDDLTREFLKDNKYNECADCMRGLKEKNKSLETVADYYFANCRFQQLKHLEQVQDWNEYFNSGAVFRQEISQSLQSAIANSQASEPVNIYSRLLLWRMQSQTQEGDPETTFNELMEASRQFAKHGSDMNAIKYAADQLQQAGRKSEARELYKIYVSRLATTEMRDDDLKSAAQGFYKEGNLDLSESVYEAYIEKISKDISKERLLVELKEAALKFCAKSPNAKDLFFAEKIFKKMEEAGGTTAFDESLLYLRAWNLEKAKDYLKAKEMYLVLLGRFPKTNRIDEINYKIGIIDAYAVSDIKQAKDDLTKLAQKETNPYSICSLYHLGLWNQWEGNLEPAQEYYNKILDTAKDAKDYRESVKAAQERLEEIKAKKPIEFNLKLFLDSCFKPENKIFTMEKIVLQASSFTPKPEENLSINANVFAGETGCLDAQLQYYWSGFLGSANPGIEQPSFDTAYPAKGPKVVKLVVVSPSGIIDRGFEIVDVAK